MFRGQTGPGTLGKQSVAKFNGEFAFVKVTGPSTTLQNGPSESGVHVLPVPRLRATNFE